MSFKSTIRISKLQSKNKMVGSAFNSCGHTIDSLNKRDSDFLNYFNSMSKNKRIKEIKGLVKLKDLCEEKGWSYPFKYNLLKGRGLIR